MAGKNDMVNEMIDDVLAKKDKRIEELDKKNARLAWRNSQLEQLATQRGARMQIMRKWIGSAGDGDDWADFLVALPEAAEWFDTDGVPVKEGK